MDLYIRSRPVPIRPFRFTGRSNPQGELMPLDALGLAQADIAGPAGASTAPGTLLVEDYPPPPARLPFNPFRKYILGYRGSVYSYARQYLQTAFNTREHNPSREMREAL